jgi:hypothetical protein
MDKRGSGMIFACVCLAIFLIVIAIYCECLRRENRELRSVVVEQQNINRGLLDVNDGLIKLNDELLETVDELTKKLNGGE